MSNDEYTRVAHDENEVEDKPTDGTFEQGACERNYRLENCLGIFALVVGIFAFGFMAGGTLTGIHQKSVRVKENGLLSPQSFIPEISTKEVVFNFPTDYEDTGELGMRLWNEMMPLGSGFVRVPHPRKYDMPPSKAIAEDPEDAEIYSMSMTHQLHCLGVIRHVIMEYEKGSKSRFAGDGHEYHCLDYSISHSDQNLRALLTEEQSGKLSCVQEIRRSTMQQL